MTKAQKRIESIHTLALELAEEFVNENLTSVRDSILSFPKTFAVLVALNVASLLSEEDQAMLRKLLLGHVAGGF